MITEIVRQRECFDRDWKFHLGDVKDGKCENCEDSQWRVVHLPHDWSIEGEYSKSNPAGAYGAFLPSGIGWYRKRFTIDNDLNHKKVFVEFDGIYMNSDVWINGNHLGHRPYGYVALVYDLTPYLKDGENILAVRVDTLKAPSGRWYTGSGIYRHTWLKITQDTYIPQWGTYVTTPIVSEQEAQVSIEATICNDSGQPKEIQIFSKILDAYKRIVAESKKIEQIVSQCIYK